MTPFIRGSPVQRAIRRLDVGGRLLTNRLKELISLRQFNLMDDTHLVNQIKEDTCFVSQNFRQDLEKCWKPDKTSMASTTKQLSLSQPTVVDYVLPDYHSSFRGHVRPHEPKAAAARFAAKAQAGDHAAIEDACVLGNERFVVPELVFTPSDIGMNQAGLPEMVIQSLECLPAGVWPAMLANVVVIGGNAKIPGLVQRFEAELRSLVPSECPVNVRSPADPIGYAWLGGTRLANDPNKLKSHVVTREQYQEEGPGWTMRRFQQ